MKRPAFEEYYELLIPSIRLWVSLGCSAEERAHLQPVDSDVKIRLAQEPVGCRSDQLEDVYCYKQLTEKIIEALKGRSFNLIEHLATHIFNVVAEQITSPNTLLEILVAKPHHPVPHVQKAISFKYCRRVP